MRTVFWLLICALLAAVTHLSYVLFVPRAQFSSSMEAALGDLSPNAFGILPSQSQMKLMPFVSQYDLVGVCRFDLGSGTVRLAIAVPAGYWEFAVYTMRGQQVYALNDRQAGTSRFKVTLARSASLLDQLSQAGGGDEPGASDIGWQVKLTEPKGVAFLWMPHGDPLRRAEAEQSLKQSTCSAAE